jgi:hypothetical protein
LPSIDLVVRNTSGSSARDTTFEFSAHVEDSKWFVVSDLPYLKQGVNSSDPAATSPASGTTSNHSWPRSERRTRRGHPGDGAIPDLTGMSCEMRWMSNPLHYEGNRHVPREGLGDVVSAWRSSTKPSLAKHKVSRR